MDPESSSISTMFGGNGCCTVKGCWDTVTLAMTGVANMPIAHTKSPSLELLTTNWPAARKNQKVVIFMTVFRLVKKTGMQGADVHRRPNQKISFA
jgi:hypothetical protein